MNRKDMTRCMRDGCTIQQVHLINDYIDFLETQLKQRDEVIEKLEKWLDERWEYPGSKIYVGEIVKKIIDLKGDNNE